MQQHSDEWFQARLGCVTASRIADVIATTKSGPAASRANYMAQLICERLTGQRQDTYTNDAMRWGTATEPLARAAYETQTGAWVTEVGFVQHPHIGSAGCSPDGLLDDCGLLEIKAPNTATHIEYLLARQPPPKYVPQMAWQCACTGRSYVDFVSYDPRLPDDLRLFIARYVPPPAYLNELEAAVILFLGELDAKIAALRPQTEALQRMADDAREMGLDY